MNSTEDLLRQALQRQADRAVEPDRVRAALPARAARRTRRRYGSMASGLVAAAALTAFAVPVLSLDDAGPQRGTDTAVGASPEGTSSASTPQRDMPDSVALKYKPTWLPAGLRERARTVPVGPGSAYDGPVRIWQRGDAGGGFYTGGSRLEFGAIALKDGANQFGDSGEPVDINGQPGRLVSSRNSGKGYVHWMIDPETVIMVNDVEMGLTDADLLRIARSVQPDPSSVTVPLTLGWLPDGMVPYLAEFVGNSPTAWKVEVGVSGPVMTDPSAGKEAKTTRSTERSFSVHLGTTSDAPSGGENITVGNRAARIVVRPIEGAPALGSHVFVVVPLESGLTLTLVGVTPGASREDLLAVAAAVKVGAMPDLGWLGAA